MAGFFEKGLIKHASLVLVVSGHKHRVRAVRRGVKPNQAILTPSSSTEVSNSTATSPSGASSESGNESSSVSHSQPAKASGGMASKAKVKAKSKVKANMALLAPPPPGKEALCKDTTTSGGDLSSRGGGSSGTTAGQPQSGLLLTSVEGVSEVPSLQRRRRSSNFIVPQNVPEQELHHLPGVALECVVALNRRHRSSGCLSRCCSHSTLSLSYQKTAAAALSRTHSRSMNLLMVHSGGGLVGPNNGPDLPLRQQEGQQQQQRQQDQQQQDQHQGPAFSCSGKDDSSSTDEGFDNGEMQKKVTVKQRPRSHSTRIVHPKEAAANPGGPRQTGAF